MADIKRLVGNDGRLLRVATGAATTTFPAKSWGLISQKAPNIKTAAGGTPVLSADLAAAQSAITLSGGNTLASAPVAGMGVYYTVNGITYSHIVGGSPSTTSIPITTNTSVIVPAGTQIFVGSRMGGLSVGEFVYNDLATDLDLTPTDGAATGTEDKIQPLTLTTLLDLSGWSLEMSADEVDVTVLGDTVKKYRKGKQDANGQMEFIFMKGETDLAGNLANYFMPISTVNVNGTVEYSARKTTPLYVLGYLDESAVTGEYTMAMLFQVEFMSFALPMNDSQAVKVSPKFRLSGSVNPTIYRIFN